jgi:hypothetical protein
MGTRRERLAVALFQAVLALPFLVAFEGSAQFFGNEWLESLLVKAPPTSSIGESLGVMFRSLAGLFGLGFSAVLFFILAYGLSRGERTASIKGNNLNQGQTFMINSAVITALITALSAQAAFGALELVIAIWILLIVGLAIIWVSFLRANTEPTGTQEPE